MRHPAESKHFLLRWLEPTGAQSVPRLVAGRCRERLEAQASYFYRIPLRISQLRPPGAHISYHGSLGSPTPVSPPPGRPTSQKILLTLAFLLSVGSLFYVLNDFEPEKLWGE